MTQRGDDAAERTALVEAMTSMLSDDNLDRRDLTIKAVAEHAGLSRHVLTHKHTDLKDLFNAAVRRIEGGNADRREMSDQIETINRLKADLEAERALTKSLSGQLAVAVLRARQLDPAFDSNVVEFSRPGRRTD